MYEKCINSVHKRREIDPTGVEVFAFYIFELLFQPLVKQTCQTLIISPFKNEMRMFFWHI